MKRLRRIIGQLGGVFSRHRSEVECAAELESHIQMQTEDNVRAGMRLEDARRAAVITFGGLQVARENCRDQRRVPFVETALKDLRYAVRALMRSPAFTAAGVLMLGLGIGANTAVFSLLNEVLLHPAGVIGPDRIVVVRTTYEKLMLGFDMVSAHTFADLRADDRVFERVAATRPGSFNHAGAEIPTRLTAAAVTGEWFDVFGAKPILGRVFIADEYQTGADRAVVLAHGAWMRLFGGDAKVIGRTIELGEEPYRIVGVMNRDFSEPRSVDVWVPLTLTPQEIAAPRWNENLSVFGRLRPGVPFSQADSWLKVIASRMIDAAPLAARRVVSDTGWRLSGTRFVDSNAGSVKTPLIILFVAVGLVLLLACSNIAGLTMARTWARAPELAVRSALGAGRGRLIRQVFSESFVLASVGGILGLLFARLAVRVLLRSAPEDVAAGLEPQFGWYVLLVAATASLLAALFFGIVSALQISHVNPDATLKSASRTMSSGRANQRIRSGLVIAEAALALTLLLSAGLFLKSLARLERTSPGFDATGIVSAGYALPQSQASDGPRQAVFAQAVLERLRSSPEITASAIGNPIPFDGGYEGASFVIDGQPPTNGHAIPQAERRWVTPDYARTLGIALERGRFLSDLDRPDTEPVTVIDTKLAREYFPTSDAVGKRIRPTSGEGIYTIIGIVSHVVQSNLAADSDRGVFYSSFLQRPRANGFILVKTTNIAAAVTAIRNVVRAVNPSLPLYDAKPMNALLSASLAPRRFAMQLLVMFAIAAVLLAALGLYGIVSYSVAQRTREIAIHLALGGQRRRVLGLVVGQGLRLAAAGVVIGVGTAVVSGKLIESQLFQVSASDPMTIVATASILMAAAALASYIPARRALAIDPAITLRCE